MSSVVRAEAGSTAKRRQVSRGGLVKLRASTRCVRLAAVFSLLALASGPIIGCGSPAELDSLLEWTSGEALTVGSEGWELGDEGVADEAEGGIDEPAEFVPGRLLVKFKPRASARSVVAEANAQIAGEIPRIGVKIIQLPPNASAVAHACAFRGKHEVEFAELDAMMLPAQTIPDDPYYSHQWHLPIIDGPIAWDFVTGSDSVIIAILDTGVDGSHPDLAEKMVPGWNMYDDNADTSDVTGHGTWVAGAASAFGNNAVGVASVAWNCRIMPIRVTNSSGCGYVSLMASGLVWAADNGARVANISFAASHSTTVAAAAQYFESHGGVVTVSAGNTGNFDDRPDNPDVLSVSATDATDTVPSWSTTGNFIDLAAPGQGIQTTGEGGTYPWGSGTSMSAPIAAGVAALVLSANPDLAASQVQDILMQSADDLGPPGWDPDYGWGRVNAANAVSLALDSGGGGSDDTTPPTMTLITPANGAEVSDLVLLDVSATDDVGVTSVTLYVDSLLLDTFTSPPYESWWDTTEVPNGAHTLEAVALDAAGNFASAQVSVTVSNLDTGDTTPPSIVITSPTDGEQIGKKLIVSVSVADDVGVERVELYVDGHLDATSTRTPFSFRRNTGRWAAGAHTLQCIAYDAAGNVGISGIVTVYK